MIDGVKTQIFTENLSIKEISISFSIKEKSIYILSFFDIGSNGDSDYEPFSCMQG